MVPPPLCVLCSKSVPGPERVHRMLQAVGASLLHGAGM